jgi:O-acetyl-ADP-ribose deacetylase (regulator of RNase III)
MSDFLNGRVRVLVGDITAERVDAIVNAANSSLMGGGGVDGAIHRAGGPEILTACKRLRQEEFPNGLPTGEAAITTGGRLPAKHVIHTVGPVYGRNAGRDAELLASCYRRSLEVAVERGLETVAFPAISTGIYGYPPEEAAGVVSQALEQFLNRRRTIREVRLVFFSPRDAQTFLAHQRFTPRSSNP